jgi:hypothetical protein
VALAFTPDDPVVADPDVVPTGVETDVPMAIAAPACPITNVTTPAVAMTNRVTCADQRPAPNLRDMG